MSSNDSVPPTAFGSEMMKKKKNIALIAHDNRKADLIDWCKFNQGSLSRHNLYGTGTTGKRIADEVELDVTCFKSGPLGGDLQIGAAIAENKIDIMFFFWDPLQAQPHDVDVKAILRIAVLYNIPTATNRASADFLISSALLDEEYERFLMDMES